MDRPIIGALAFSLAELDSFARADAQTHDRALNEGKIVNSRAAASDQRSHPPQRRAHGMPPHDIRARADVTMRRRG